MLKRLAMLLVSMWILLSLPDVSLGQTVEEYVPPKTPPLGESAALADDNRFLEAKDFGKNYFVSYNPAQKLELNMETYSQHNNTHLLFYGGPSGEKGSNGEYRYIGVNDMGEYLPNIRYPMDVTPVHDYLEQNNWLPNPWDLKEVRQWMANRGETIVHNPKLDGNPKLRKNIWWGLKLMHTEEFRGDENFEWEKYVHVLQPPTFWGWGWGRAWHKVGESILYRSVPIAPESAFVKWIPNLYVKDLNPGTPVEKDESGNDVYAAEPTTTYTGTVTFGIESENQWVKFLNVPTYIGFAHQINESSYYGQLAFGSGNGTITGPVSAYPLAPSGMKFQTIKFNDDNSEITATFNWTAQAGTKNLTVGINSWPGLRYLYEGETGLEYEDNTVTVPITIKPIPDAYVADLNPGTQEIKPEEEYTGAVTYGLDEDFPGLVECKLGLTHNNWPVPGVDGEIITLNPGETKSVSFLWHGQKAGQNSALVAKIWPQKPTMKDSDWSNNTKRADLYQSTDLTVYNLIPGNDPFHVKGSYNGSVIVKNNMTVTAKNVVVKFFKGNAEIPGTRHIISSLGPNASTTVNFSWIAPAAKGEIKIAASVNPDRVIPETNYDNNYISIPVYINNEVETKGGGQLHISATANPTKTKAGMGFGITVSTWTDPYVEYVMEGNPPKLVRKEKPCPGPQRVIAYFADGNYVELERTNPGRPSSNTWQLPPNPNSPQNLRKKYIPVDTQDGEFITKIVAEKAGNAGEFTATVSVTVIVEGSIYDDVGSRITQ